MLKEPIFTAPEAFNFFKKLSRQEQVNIMQFMQALTRNEPEEVQIDNELWQTATENLALILQRMSDSGLFKNIPTSRIEDIIDAIRQEFYSTGLFGQIGIVSATGGLNGNGLDLKFHRDSQKFFIEMEDAECILYLEIEEEGTKDQCIRIDYFIVQ